MTVLIFSGGQKRFLMSSVFFGEARGCCLCVRFVQKTPELWTSVAKTCRKWEEKWRIAHSLLCRHLRSMGKGCSGMRLEKCGVFCSRSLKGMKVGPVKRESSCWNSKEMLRDTGFYSSIKGGSGTGVMLTPKRC